MREIVVVHFDELALKQGRRPYYEKALVHAVEAVLRDVGPVTIRAAHGRFVVTPGRRAIPAGLLVDRLSRVFGIHHLFAGVESARDPASLAAAAVEAARRAEAGGGEVVRTFSVRVRGNDRGEGRARPLEAELGGAVASATGWTVDLDRPDVALTVELAAGRAFVLHRRVEGPGGLPYATAGQAVALLSGGIDSPVAAAMMMSRGLRIGLVHFHSRPITSEAALRKVYRLAGALTRWQPTIFGVMVPFAETVQRPLVEGAPTALRTVLARRFMLRIAERLASEHRSRALVTGDALAQVSSQTLENLAVTDSAVRMPVFRPLVGMGKPEIVERARRIGTLAISEEEGDDCCALLAPRNPEKAATAEAIEAAESALPVETMIRSALDSMTRFRVRFEDTDT